MKKLLFLTKLFPMCLVFLFFNSSMKASECYHYHTNKTYNLKNISGKLFLESIEKDPNKISIVSYTKILLKNISPNKSSICSENKDGIIIKNQVAYYYISKNSLLQKTIIIDKIADVKTVTVPPIGLTFFINGIWKKLKYNLYYPTVAQRVTFNIVKNIPKKGTLFRTFFYGEHPIYLLKDNLHVYIFDEDESRIRTIQNINPNNAKINELAENSDEFCIYDDNTFYLTRDNFRTLENATSQFKDSSLKQSFLDLKFHRPNSFRTYLDFQDGALWSYVSAGISLEQGGDVNFYRVKSSKYLEPSGLVLHKGFLYEDPWDLVNEHHPIDLPKAGNIKDYTLNIDGSYTFDKSIYKLREVNGRSILEKVSNAISIESDAVATYNNAIWSYRQPTPQFYLNNKTIRFYNSDTQKTDRTIKHKSGVKNLKLAFAFDDKLLIENKVIKSSADYQSIEFLGSIVKPISPCDGGKGQINIVINYEYYFKDKNDIYIYRTGNKGLVKLKNKKAVDCTQANFIETFWTENK